MRTFVARDSEFRHIPVNERWGETQEWSLSPCNIMVMTKHATWHDAPPTCLVCLAYQGDDTVAQDREQPE